MASFFKTQNLRPSFITDYLTQHFTAFFWHTRQNSLGARNTGVNSRTSSEWLACICWEQWISELDFTTTLTTVLDIFQSWALLWTEKQTNIFIPRANLTAGLKIARLLLGMLNMQSYQTKLIKLKPLKAPSFCSRLTVWKTKDFAIILSVVFRLWSF